MVCLSVMMLACFPIPSPVRSLSTATGTLASRASWAASTSAPRTWLLTRLEVGVTGSMRLSAPTVSQPRGYKPRKRPVMLRWWPPRSRSQLWVVISSDNIPIQGEMWQRPDKLFTLPECQENCLWKSLNIVCFLNFVWIRYIGKFSPPEKHIPFLSFFKKSFGIKLKLPWSFCNW